MFRKRTLAVLAAISMLGLAACGDVTGPDQAGWCPVTGGPGTCPGAVAR